MAAGPAPAVTAGARSWGVECRSSRSEPEPQCPSRLQPEALVWVRRERDRETLPEDEEDLERRWDLVARLGASCDNRPGGEEGWRVDGERRRGDGERPRGDGEGLHEDGDGPCGDGRRPTAGSGSGNGHGSETSASAASGVSHQDPQALPTTRAHQRLAAG